MRNGTKQMSGVCVRHILMPYGMREIDGYGKNVWEFFNRQYDVIGLPFRLAKRPTDASLMAASWQGSSADLYRSHEFGRIVFFAADSELDDGVLKRVARVLEWKLHADDGELCGLPAVEYPHSFCKAKPNLYGK